MNDELKNFFEVAFELRNQCEESNDPLKSAKIDALAKVCAEVVKVGKVPSQFYIEGNYPIHTELVENLLKELSIEIKTTLQDKRPTPGGTRYWVNFCTF